MVMFVKYALLIISAVMTVVILMQGGRADGLTTVLTGGNRSLNLFATTKSRGSDIWFDRITLSLAVSFIVLVTVLRVI